MRYYGLQEYGRRWWSSRSSTSSQITSNADSASTKKTAQIAFMITSEQRRLLGELGYSSNEIRSFKPIEALFLVKNSIQKQSDFREKLKVLIDENDKLMKAEQQAKLEKTRIESVGKTVDRTPERVIHPRDLSPEEVEKAHVKPDVALALLESDRNEEENYQSIFNEDKNVVEANIEELKASKENAVTQSILANRKHLVKPSDAEELHMKPDVAAAYLSSHQSNNSNQEEVDMEKDEESTEPSWYEVIEVNKETEKEQIIALFSNKKEATECARIKESFRSRGKDNAEVRSSFFVRRRWNV